MGRGWVHGVREAAGAKKGKAFTKIAKEITVAVKLAGPLPENNARLRSALEDARKNSMPRDTIDRAIKRGTGGSDEAALEEITYEAYGPHGVAVLIETLTDNRNRTVQDLRALLARKGGSLGESGSVMWMFDRVGSVIAKSPKAGTDSEEAAIMAGADEVEDIGDQHYRFICGPTDVDTVSKALAEGGWVIEKGELAYKPKAPATPTEDQEKDLQVFVEAIDDNDDVKKIHLAL